MAIFQDIQKTEEKLDKIINRLKMINDLDDNEISVINLKDDLYKELEELRIKLNVLKSVDKTLYDNIKKSDIENSITFNANWSK